jgi:hypothetical protein
MTMDPQAAWDEVLLALAEDHLAEAGDRARGLEEWLFRGGFPPQTTRRLSGDAEVQKSVALAVCRLVISEAERKVDPR